jgi:RNA polymerase sigma-70 factor (ECF subfamily)
MSGSVTINSRNGTVVMDNGTTKIEADQITIALPPEDMWDPTHFQPVVVKTVPESGDLKVPSSTTELKVTFSKGMMSGSYSWCQFSDESFPKTTGDAHYVDARTCVLPMKLEPHHHYVIGLNTPPFSNFQDAERRPAGYYVLAFDTGD